MLVIAYDPILVQKIKNRKRHVRGFYIVGVNMLIPIPQTRSK